MRLYRRAGRKSCALAFGPSVRARLSRAHRNEGSAAAAACAASSGMSEGSGSVPCASRRSKRTSSGGSSASTAAKLASDAGASSFGGPRPADPPLALWKRSNVVLCDLCTLGGIEGGLAGLAGGTVVGASPAAAASPPAFTLGAVVGEARLPSLSSLSSRSPLSAADCHWLRVSAFPRVTSLARDAKLSELTVSAEFSLAGPTATSMSVFELPPSESCSRPGSLSVPSIVYVLPVPDWPYAKMHTLYPSRTDVIKSEVAWKTSSWVESGPKTCVKSNSRFELTFSPAAWCSTLLAAGVDLDDAQGLGAPLGFGERADAAQYAQVAHHILQLVVQGTPLVHLHHPLLLHRVLGLQALLLHEVLLLCRMKAAFVAIAFSLSSTTAVSSGGAGGGGAAARKSTPASVDREAISGPRANEISRPYSASNASTAMSAWAGRSFAAGTNPGPIGIECPGALMQ
eukprot:jgi/Chrpa1/14503/Chrysochromulina_OHIO_Genome00014691-RA